MEESRIAYSDSVKLCPRCELEKPFDDFYYHPNTKDKRQPNCKDCTNAHNRERRLVKHQDPEFRRKELDKKSENHYKRRHGLTRLERDQYIIECGSVCGVCGTTDPGKRGWQLDHDHSCCPPEHSCSSCRRGILCVRCNTAIGLFDDDPNIVEAALKYLNK